MEEIAFLKHEGHILMDEYVALDLVREPIHARKNGYLKLAKRMRKRESHFKKLNTKKELLEAIRNLNAMIEKRKDKNKDRGFLPIKIAPNVRELQKNIKFEKIG